MLLKPLGSFLMGAGFVVGAVVGVSLIAGINVAGLPLLVAIGLGKLTFLGAIGLMGVGAGLRRLATRQEQRRLASVSQSGEEP